MNTRGLGNKNKRKSVFDYYRNKADILCFQETHSSERDEYMWQSEWGEKILFAHGDSNARGVCILVNKSFKGEIEAIHRDLAGRYIIARVQENNVEVNICNLYAPNKDEPNFFIRLRKDLEQLSEKHILIGDFNLVLNNELDRFDSVYNNHKSAKILKEMMEEMYLTDVWRDRNPDAKQYSWYRVRDAIMQKGSRIDNAIVSRGIDRNVQLIMYIGGMQSDHRALILTVIPEDYERGAGYWKFNNTLLANKEFVNEMNKEISLTLKSVAQTAPIEKWEKIKQRIIKCAKNFARNKSAMNKEIIANLSEVIDGFESRLPLPEAEYNLLNTTKQELTELQSQRAEALIFRSKARWAEFGEKSTKYFLNLEKARYNAKTATEMYDKEGILVKNPSKVLDIQREFYQELYKKNPKVNFQYSNSGHPKISTDQKSFQSIPFTEKDFSTALKGMANNKTPGNDGITADFYKVFWRSLSRPFTEAMTEAYQKQQLHKSAREGVLNLIPKSGKDPRLVGNLRPITLLNCDYKILERAIAQKIEPSLHTIIDSDQKGFLKGRRISVNIRKMLDIIKKANDNQIEALILSLDFSKAFDLCEKDALIQALRFFDFNEYIINWTSIIYDQFSVKVQNNGNFSQSVEKTRSLHQGGPASSFYFLVIAELLAIQLRKNGKIKGVLINEIMNLINQFADDTDLFLNADEESISETVNELEKFRLNTGLTINYDKTLIYRIGSLANSNAKLYTSKDIAWTNSGIKVLGVHIQNDEQECVKVNLKELEDKAYQILSQWSRRRLSLLGKIRIVNTLIASLFVYKFTVLSHIGEDFYNRLDEMINKFLWNGKQAKISMKVLRKNVRNGGANLVDLRKREKSLKVTWLQILNSDEKLAEMVYKEIQADLGESIWECNIHPNEVSKLGIKNKFWEEVLIAWALLNYNNWETGIYNQMIWFNSEIKQGKEWIWDRRCYAKGLKYVRQLFENGVLISCKKAWDTYNLDVMTFNAIVSALPRHWKEYYRQDKKINCKTLYERCKVKSNLASYVYKMLNENESTVSQKAQKWSEKLGRQIDPGEMRSQFKTVYVTTNEPKLRSFQYRLLHNAIVTNKRLYQWKVKDSPKCAFCQEEETIEHLMFFCLEVQGLWKNVKKYLDRLCCETFFTLETVMWNRIHKSAKNIANFVCLLIKHYIYVQRCGEKELSWHEAEALIYRYKNIEKYIAIKNGMVAKFNKKWCTFNEAEIPENEHTNYVISIFDTNVED